ncbi:hypothetical protein DERP_005011 [Dermatophagoides pteronyssinus]|uniref:Uncharacterized protein n=1 Tax=Dermatophagoides pteronyssinus TaxID=6956 RepID=A0ABQ8JTR3_DERPT|nr:hypothetical protein DERP_005011 [Dermatophagoides pteronyssinus]
MTLEQSNNLDLNYFPFYSWLILLMVTICNCFGWSNRRTNDVYGHPEQQQQKRTIVFGLYSNN